MSEELSRWSLKYVLTLEDGLIQSPQYITDVVEDFRIESTVGDELFIKSGDISITSLNSLPFNTTASFGNWILAYYDDTLIDAFYMPDDFDEREEKRTRYKIQLYSIQKKFFDDCQDVLIKGNQALAEWGKDLDQAAVELGQVKVLDGDSNYQSQLARWGFSLGDMLTSMQGSEDKKYGINSVSYPGPVLLGSDIPILFRGESYAYASVSEDDAIIGTFEDHGVTWFDLFRIASIAFNSFIRVEPVIVAESGNSYLRVNVSLIPKINLSAGSAVATTWKDRKYFKRKFRLDGVKVDSSISDVNGNPCFSYAQGNIAAGKIFSRDVSVGDPNVPITDYANTLYMVAGDWNDIIEIYDINDGGGDNRGYFAEGLVEPYYANMLTDGKGYSGDIFYGGQKVLDQVQIGSDVMQINKLRMTKKKKFSIEGLKIDY